MDLNLIMEALDTFKLEAESKYNETPSSVLRYIMILEEMAKAHSINETINSKPK